MISRWRVLVATQREERANQIEQALAPHRLVSVISLQDDLLLGVQRAQPDVLIVESGEPVPGLLGQIRAVMERQPLPIVVFSDRSPANEVRAAVKAGASAYVVDGFQPKRLLPIIEAAMARFTEFQALRIQRDEAVEKLAERRDVERAKGILMRRRDLAEQAAYDALRKMAMDRGARMIEVAKSIIAAEELLAQH